MMVVEQVHTNNGTTVIPLIQLVFLFFCLSESSCNRNLDDLIESLGAKDTSAVADKQPPAETADAAEDVYGTHSGDTDDAKADGEELKEHGPEDSDEEAEEANKETKDEEQPKPPELHVCSEESNETKIEDVGAEQPPTSLRRRNRPE